MEVKHVRDLMEAYSSVYSQSEETLDENVQDAVKGALEAGAKFMKTNPVGKFVGSVLAPVGPERPTTTQAQQQAKVKQNVKEEDLFDLIKGHLIAEGYADTEEAALKIMANMSEEWRQSIVEQTPPFIEDLYDYKDGGGKAKEAQGMSKQSVIELGRKNRDRLTGLKGDGSRVSQSHQRTYTQMGGDARARQLGIRPDGTYK